MDASLASLIMVRAGWVGGGLVEVVGGAATAMTVHSFIFLLVTSVTLLQCSQEQKKENLT